jgi:hypothetical protein
VVDWNKSLASSLGRVGLVAAALVAAATPGGALGADWHLNSSITEEFTYDDNFRLRSTNEESLWGLNTRPHVGIESHAPRTDLYLNGSLNYGYFPETTNQDSFDQSGDITLSHRTERDSFGLSGNVSHATTRTTEDLDTGRDLSNSSRLGMGGNASWSRTLTERVSAGLTGGASYVTYDTDVLDDYRTYSGGPFVSFVLTERDSLQLNGTYSRYDRLSGLDLNSDLFVANGTWSHVFTPQFKGSISGGANYVTTDEDVQVGNSVVSTNSDKIGYDTAATVTYTEERATLSGSYAHTVVPSGTGRLQRRDSVSLNASYKPAPLVTVGLNTSFIQQDAAESNTEDRSFVSAEPSLSWNFLPDWTARVAYRFRTQTLDNGDRAFSNGGVASVSWSLPQWSAGQGK